MMLIILAASGDNGLDWLDRFMDTSDDDRTNDGAVGDVHDVRATIICPEMYDQIDTVLNPAKPDWSTRVATKIIRTDAWSLDQRVERALHALHLRHPLCDPTGLLGCLDGARVGWQPLMTAPLGSRKAAPATTRRKSGLSGAGLQLPH